MSWCMTHQVRLRDGIGINDMKTVFRAFGLTGAACRRVAVWSAVSSTASNNWPKTLEHSASGCLIQARIGFGERGRGLFFSPADQPRSDASATDSQSQQHVLRHHQQHPSVLRVPLNAGLVLVTGPQPGPDHSQLQRELLREWQSCHGLVLPGRLVALLEDIQKPPALRLAAWLLWATQISTGVAAGAPGHERPGADCPAAPRAASLSAEGRPSEDDPSPQPHPAVPPGHLLAEYARHLLPPPGSPGASCLRLEEAEERLLPMDVRAALTSARAQVTSYISELRSAGLDWGLGDDPLWWAFDMVVSRSFSATASLPPAPEGTTPWSSAALAAAPVTLAMYVPWACLINHGSSPNATFQVDLRSRLFSVALRPRSKALPAGSELLISYGEALDNVQLLVKYGFVVPGNANDRLPLPPELLGPARGLRRQALCSAAEQVADRLVSSGGGAGEGAASEGGSLEVQRTRVFTALASLLQPTGGSGLCDATRKGLQEPIASNLGGLLAWSAEEGSVDCGVGMVGASGPSSSCMTSICALRKERKFLAADIYRILQIYFSTAGGLG